MISKGRISQDDLDKSCPKLFEGNQLEDTINLLKNKMQNKTPKQIIKIWEKNEREWKLHDNKQWYNAGFYAYIYFDHWVYIRKLMKSKRYQTVDEKNQRRWKVLAALMKCVIYIGTTVRNKFIFIPCILYIHSCMGELEFSLKPFATYLSVLLKILFFISH